MTDNVQVRLVGTDPDQAVTIQQTIINPNLPYESLNRWADMSTIKEIMEAHTNSRVYTWVLYVLPSEIRGGTPRVFYYDYVNVVATELPLAFSQTHGVLYDITMVPLTYV